MAPRVLFLQNKLAGDTITGVPGKVHGASLRPQVHIADLPLVLKLVL